VQPAGSKACHLPAVTVAPRSKAVEFTLASHGTDDIVYTLTKNDYEGSNREVKVKGGSAKTVRWPAGQDGYYDVVITANTGDGFRRRYAGRVT
jgi:phospholipase C